MNGIAQINGHKKLIFYDEFNKGDFYKLNP